MNTITEIKTILSNLGKSKKSITVAPNNLDVFQSKMEAIIMRVIIVDIAAPTRPNSLINT